MGMNYFGVGIAVKNNIEAVALYQKVFGLELGFVDHFPEGDPRHGKYYMHAVLLKDGKELFSVASIDPDAEIEKQHGFGVRFDNEDEVRKAFALLSEGGVIKNPLGSVSWSPYCGDVIDKYGVSWWISV